MSQFDKGFLHVWVRGKKSFFIVDPIMSRKAKPDFINFDMIFTPSVVDVWLCHDMTLFYSDITRITSSPMLSKELQDNFKAS